jgi:hypothetical protein
MDLFYWAGRNREFDVVLSGANQLIAIEIKPTAYKMRIPGIAEFSKQFPAAKKTFCGKPGGPVGRIFAHACGSVVLKKF